MTAQAREPDPRQFGRFRLTERLGAGGMAVVYRGVAEGPQGFSRSVVIKRIQPGLSSNPTFIEMLANEARLCGLLQHPGIVQVHEFGDCQGEFYLAMEYVDGFDLSVIFRECRRQGVVLPIGVCCHIVREVADALDYAHSLADGAGRPLGIVHRDVSPSNIMVTAQGGTKLLDFGIAKAVASIRNHETHAGTLKGKLSYMSPEQADGRHLDGRSDLFALGIVFHESLVLRRLFAGNSDLETLRLVRESNVSPPSSVRSDVDGEVDAIVMKLLAREPRDRFASGREVVDALAPIVRRLHGDAVASRTFLEQLAPPRQSSLLSTPTFPVDGPSSVATAVAHDLANDSKELIVERGTELPLEDARRRTDRHQAKRGMRKRWLWPVGVGSALAIATTGFLLAGQYPFRSNNKVAPIIFTEPTPPLHSEGATPLPPSPRAPQRAHITIGGTTGAQVFIDARPMGEVPLDLDLDTSPRPRQVRVVQRGFAAWTQTIAGDHDVVLTATLKRVRREKRIPPAAPSHHPSDLSDPFESH